MSAVRKKSLLITAYMEYLIKFYFTKPQSSKDPEKNGMQAIDGFDIYVDIITPR